MQRYDFNFYAAYHQIELTDSDEVPDESQWEICLITDEDLQRRIKVEPGIIKIFTGRFGVSPLSIELHEAEPDADFLAWDHVVEVSLQMISELLTVGGLNDGPEKIGRVPMQPGSYRVRLQCAGLDSIRDPDLDGGDDSYLVKLWLAPEQPLAVLKQYTRN